MSKLLKTNNGKEKNLEINKSTLGAFMTLTFNCKQRLTQKLKAKTSFYHRGKSIKKNFQ